jgi:hypothetical protein
MNSVTCWRAVETAGGQQHFDIAVTAMPDDARGSRLAECARLHDDPGAGPHPDGRLRRRIPQIESGDAPSGDFELFVAEVRDELEGAAQGGDEAAEEVLG